MYKLGLKLWSINTDYYYDEAIRLYNDGVFDYIELYVVPDTLETIPKWKNIGIPINLHAPHFDSGANLAEKSKEQLNYKIYDNVKLFQQELNPEYVVVHCGIEGTIEEVIRQLKNIKLSNMLLENKPHVAPTDANLRCRGAIYEEMKRAINELGCDFCLDISHCICTANSLNINPYEYIQMFNTLQPKCYHICDNFIDNEIDSHKHFGQGSFNFDKIFKLMNRDANIAIETTKDSKFNLNDFIVDVNFIKKYLLRA